MRRKPRSIIRRSNFAGLARVLAAEQLPPADVVLADLGVSSMQLDDPARGFTFKREGPLDLRMNPQRGQPASRLLASLDASGLADVLEENGDVADAEVLARAIVDRHQRSAITTTTALAEAVAEAVAPTVGRQPGETVESTIRKVFQALRIAVNDEYGALEAFLRLLPQCMAPGGRVAILTFHSGEDRRVKQAFKDGLRSGAFARIADGDRAADSRRAARQSSFVGGEAALGGSMNHVQRASRATSLLGQRKRDDAARAGDRWHCIETAATANRDGWSRRRDQQVLPAIQLVHRRRAARRRSELELPDLFAGLAVVNVNLAVRGGDEQEAGGRRDDAPLHRCRRARALHALPDKAKVVAKANLPLERALLRSYAFSVV